MPAIASAPPDGISTVVSARRVRIEGTVSVWVEPGIAMVSALSVERSDTSVMTLRLMRPSLSTTGVKFRLTPNFLNSIDGWQIGGDLVVSQGQDSRSDRKLAAGDERRVSPEIAVRLGSASVRMTPARSIACNVAGDRLKRRR